MVYFVIKYRKENNPIPTNIPGNITLEIIWIVIPTLIALGMFWVGYIGFEKMRKVPENAMVVKVSARMWSWSFKYKNGKKSKELYVPIGKPVKLEMSSKDVIHSFYIPAFRVKEDVLPERTTYLWFEARKQGTFTVYCAEYCGELHSSMLSKVHVLSQKEFDNWYDLSKKEITNKKINNKPPGLKLLEREGCLSCHSIDSSVLFGPSFKNIYMRKTIVISDNQEKEVIANDAYIKDSILTPKKDIVKGYKPIMPSLKGHLSEEEIVEIINYFKTISSNEKKN
jgi:cytochrome c oxidase subunit 2